jgi:hypothetical protein
LGSGLEGDVLPMTIVETVGSEGLTPEIIEQMKALTYQTGNEYALVTLSTGENAIVSGGSAGIQFAEGDISSIIAHTHPYDATSGFPSAGDVQALQQLNQESSVIIWRGQMIRFGQSGQSLPL